MSFEDDRSIWGTGPAIPLTTTDQRRRAAVRTADYVAGQHPDRTARDLAADPLIQAGLRELLTALGLTEAAP
ncbi:hypothetical protein [Streptomyces sp. NPDC059783]|uniref:hypothetical protein n=1 Tax=Streptomyces sp. NPDC059783 TaxID=3346944 RepID=UPI00366797A2